MRSKRDPRILVTIVWVTMTLVMLAAVAAGRGRTRLPAEHLSFAEDARAVNTPQTGGRKRSSRRKTPAKSAKTEETKAQSTNQTQAQPALPTSQGPLSQVHYELPIRKPGPGEDQARGLLERVDCNGNVATFTVQAGARTLKLHAANFNAVQYKTYTPDVSGDITCGVRNPANDVVVTFRPAKGARAKFNGDLIVVEFVPKDFQLKK